MAGSFPTPVSSGSGSKGFSQFHDGGTPLAELTIFSLANHRKGDKQKGDSFVRCIDRVIVIG